MAIDATECWIERPSEWNVQKIFYNGHKKKHCLKYEIGVNWINGLICWLAGPIQGSAHDITLSKTMEIVANRELLQPDEQYWI